MKFNVQPVALFAFARVYFRYLVRTHQGLDAARWASKNALANVWKRSNLSLRDKQNFIDHVVAEVAPKNVTNFAGKLVACLAPLEPLKVYHALNPNAFAIVDDRFRMTVVQMLCCVIGPEILSKEEEAACQFVVDKTPIDSFGHVEPHTNKTAIALAANAQLKFMIVEKYRRNGRLLEGIGLALQIARIAADANVAMADRPNAEEVSQEKCKKRQRTE